MYSSKKDLADTLEKIRDLPVVVVGDIILDRYIWGAVSRISPEAPIPVVDVVKIENRLGGAGNVLMNLKSLGAEARLCGFVGDDAESETVLKLLSDSDVDRDGIMIDRGRPTCLKTRVIAHAQHVVRIDQESAIVQGVALREGFAALVDAHIDEARAVIVSDYAKGAVSAPLMKKLIEARSAGRLGLPGKPLVIDPRPVNYELYQKVDIAKPNRREAEAASGMKINDRESAVKAGKFLLKKWEAQMILVSLGEDGLVIVTDSEGPGIVRDTVAREVFDVSGAGDTVTAIFTAAIAAGAKPAVAGDLANLGAGIVVSEVGTAPINRARLVKAIEELEK